MSRGNGTASAQLRRILQGFRFWLRRFGGFQLLEPKMRLAPNDWT